MSIQAQGSYNTSYGESALSDNRSGSSDSAFGFEALTFNDSGSDNTAIGVEALGLNVDGNQNTASGRGALRGQELQSGDPNGSRQREHSDGFSVTLYHCWGKRQRPRRMAGALLKYQRHLQHRSWNERATPKHGR